MGKVSTLCHTSISNIIPSLFKFQVSMFDAGVFYVGTVQLIFLFPV